MSASEGSVDPWSCVAAGKPARCSQEGIACCLIGARSPERLEQNVKAAAKPLPAEVVEELNRVTQPVLDNLGPSFDYYEGVSNDRTR